MPRGKTKILIFLAVAACGRAGETVYITNRTGQAWIVVAETEGGGTRGAAEPELDNLFVAARVNPDGSSSRLPDEGGDQKPFRAPMDPMKRLPGSGWRRLRCLIAPNSTLALNLSRAPGRSLVRHLALIRKGEFQWAGLLSYQYRVGAQTGAGLAVAFDRGGPGCCNDLVQAGPNRAEIAAGATGTD